MTNDRDTHFENAARWLWQKLDNVISENRTLLYYFDPIQQEAIRLTLAQYSYDLAYHVADEVFLDVSNNCTDMYDHMTIESVFADIPDLTEWPTPPN